MHTLDIFFIVIAAILIAIGVRRGLVGELFRLIGLVAGSSVAFIYYPDLGRIFRLDNVILANTVAFIILFLVVFLVAIGVGWVVKKIIHLTPLGWIDYIFGGLIGLAKTALIFWVVCLSISTFPFLTEKLKFNQSYVYSTYRKFPSALKLQALLRMRDSLRKNAEKTMPKQSKKVRGQVESLKSKVDSLKRTELKYR